jgi:hypothetical protein
MEHKILRKILFSSLWISLISYAFFLAPPDQANTLDLIVNLSTGNWQGINPLIVALFNLMGILPIIYACFLLIDGRGQKIPAWLFTSASFGVGAFAILPYLALRQPNSEWQGDKNLLIKILDSRITGIFLTLGTLILLFLGVFYGNWGDFAQQWQSNRFIHVMSLDFCLLSLLLPVLVKDDLPRRNIKQKWVFWIITLIPLFGTLGYLCVRPPLRAIAS